MSLSSRGLALVLAIAFAGPAGAEEVTLGMASSLRYDTDARNRNGLAENGWEIDITPHIQWAHDGPRLDYSGYYRAQYHRSVTDDQDGVWSHFASTGGSWYLGPRTVMSWSDGFSKVDRPTYFSNQGTTEPGNPETNPGANDINTGTSTITRNIASLTLSHQMTKRQSLAFAANYSLARSGSSAQFDNNVFSGQAYTSYRASRRATFDLGVVSTYTVIDGTDRQPGSRTTSFQTFGGLEYRITPSLTFSARGGPTAVRSKSRAHTSGNLVVPRYQVAGQLIDLSTGLPVPQPAAYALDSCAVFEDQPILGAFVNTAVGRLGLAQGCTDAIVSGPNGEPLSDIGVEPSVTTDVAASHQASEDFRVNFFGEASLNQSWRYVDAGISYRRTESPSTQSGGNTSVDSLSGHIGWHPPGPWNLSLSGGWSLRRSLSDVVINQFSPSLVESARDSGLTGLDALGNLRPIAEADSIVISKISNAVDVTQWSVATRISHKIQRNGFVAFDIRYRRQEANGDVLRGGTTNTMFATISVDYSLDPFVF